MSNPAENLLQEIIVAMKHARVFISSRDASVTAEQAAEHVRKEQERNANRDKPVPAPKDGFINDYD